MEARLCLQFHAFMVRLPSSSARSFVSSIPSTRPFPTWSRSGSPKSSTLEATAARHGDVGVRASTPSEPRSRDVVLLELLVERRAIDLQERRGLRLVAAGR